ncbi:MAG: methyltransferase domain-containing protein [Candidatus Eisenbacteria bacterium]|uniref:Methyltransferase domain-containing protein n=1 Tax=Eiseniibacteriota bacterium TaxID=2212470 RepID=A0A849SD88_UNCEI|nr:methyltransferase domain-containing protein [Candidatus Eisenbacteria bacterium]
MSQPPDQDYVLGTHDAEIARLALQNRVWRDCVLAGFDRAGIGPGARVIDVGAGPGFVTMELARRVGPSGRVIGFERSARFLAHARAACEREGLSNVELREVDLDQVTFEPLGFDASFCRWVAAFVTRPDHLIDNLSRALAPGGRAIFHEYVDYRSWRTSPACPVHERFVGEVIASWREQGGEPDIAQQLPALLLARGFRLLHTTPLVFCTRPGDSVWPWPEAFIFTGAERLRELGRVDTAFVEALHEEYRRAAANPATFTLTPLVLEIVAERVAP